MAIDDDFSLETVVPVLRLGSPAPQAEARHQPQLDEVVPQRPVSYENCLDVGIRRHGGGEPLLGSCDKCFTPSYARRVRVRPQQYFVRGLNAILFGPHQRVLERDVGRPKAIVVKGEDGRNKIMRPRPCFVFDVPLHIRVFGRQDAKLARYIHALKVLGFPSRARVALCGERVELVVSGHPKDSVEARLCFGEGEAEVLGRLADVAAQNQA